MDLNKIKELLPSDKKTNIIIVLVSLVVLWALLSPIVSDFRGGIDTIRSELSEVRQHQLDATKRLDNIETGISSSANRIGGVSERIITNTDRIVEVERRIETSQTGLGESQRIINESKSILDSVRKRGQVGN